MHTVKTILRNLVMAVLAVVLLFEEWGWEPLANLFNKLARLPLWAWLEGVIRRLPPWAALLVFGVPVLALLPVKLGALYLFGQGHVTMGLTLLLVAKLTGTAVMARLFQLTQPALMQLPWFARWYPRWKNWKDELLARVRQSEAWQMGRRAKAQAAQWWANLRG